MPSRKRRSELDEVDLELVAALRRDGRASNVELARELRVSEKTVRARIARLTAEHGLVVTAELPDPTLRSRMVYLIRTDPGRRAQVGDLLAGYAEVERVALVTGSADLLVTGRFADDATALRFQLQVVERAPGVRSVATCHVIGDVGGPERPAGVMTPRVDTAALSALMVSTGQCADVTALNDAICDAAVVGLGADRVGISLRRSDSATTPPVIAASRGLSAEYVGVLEQLVRSGRADGVIKRVWQTRQHLVVADALADPLLADAREVVREEGYRTLLSLPVLYGDSMLATVTFYWDRPTELGDAYLATAQSTVDHFAVAFARVRGLAPRPPGERQLPATGTADD